jgi:hypothetical protein
MGEKSNAYRILVGKPEGRRPPGRLTRRREDNIKMDLREIVWGAMDLYCLPSITRIIKSRRMR